MIHSWLFVVLLIGSVGLADMPCITTIYLADIFVLCIILYVCTIHACIETLIWHIVEALKMCLMNNTRAVNFFNLPVTC